MQAAIKRVNDVQFWWWSTPACYSYAPRAIQRHTELSICISQTENYMQIKIKGKNFNHKYTYTHMCLTMHSARQCGRGVALAGNRRMHDSSYQHKYEYVCYVGTDQYVELCGHMLGAVVALVLVVKCWLVPSSVSHTLALPPQCFVVFLNTK